MDDDAKRTGSQSSESLGPFLDSVPVVLTQRRIRHLQALALEIEARATAVQLKGTERLVAPTVASCRLRRIRLLSCAGLTPNQTVAGTGALWSILPPNHLGPVATFVS